MKVKTTHTEQIWQSPDGTRKIWEVTLKDESGSDYRLKTYSPKVGSLGFEGDVKSYVNRYGERFVRQVLPEKATSKGGGYTRDDSAIRAQWAIGQAINLAAVKMDKDAITLPIIEKYAKELFATVSRVKGEPLTPEQEAEAEQFISGFTKSNPATT
jgi:hypothetical protein